MGMLEIKNLSIHFGGIKALDGIDLAVRDNEILLDHRPEWFRKDHPVQLPHGDIPPRSRATWSTRGEPPRALPDAIAIRGIARTFQNLRLFMNMNVLDNLMLGRHVHMKKNILLPF